MNDTQKSKNARIAAWYNGVAGLTLAGVVLYLLALPPVSLWWLGWLVAACWTPILRRKTLPQRAYRQIWLCGVIFWAVAVHWICYAHWATCFGWVALCCYLGIYFPLFFYLARTLHHTPIYGNMRVPLWFAAPVAYLAAMYLQKTLMGGFAFALLEHTQARQTALIQLADIGGESLVGAVMIFVGVLFGYCLPVEWPTSTTNTNNANYPKITPKLIAKCLISVVVTFLLLVTYAKWRDSQYQPSDKPPLCMALLQGSFKASLSAPPEWYYENFEYYTKMALEAASNTNHNVDVIIWPESTCVDLWCDIDRSEITSDEMQRLSEEKIINFLFKIEENQAILELTQRIGKPCIYGVGSFVYSEANERNYQYNSALLIEMIKETNYDSLRQVRVPSRYARYDKMLLVMFGEYIPFADLLPDGFFLKTLCQRADFGKHPTQFCLCKINDDNYDHKYDNFIDHQYHATANICFESSSSRLIRHQLLTLKADGKDTDFIINISNDGWFRHSSQIDMHLATHIFRAVENRKPYLAATNGGFSCGIDGSGQIIAIGQRENNQVVYVDVTADNRFSAYHFVGSFFHITSFVLLSTIVTHNICYHRKKPQKTYCHR